MSHNVPRHLDLAISLLLPALIAGCGGGSPITPDPDGGLTTSSSSSSGAGGAASGTGGAGGTSPAGLTGTGG